MELMVQLVTLWALESSNRVVRPLRLQLTFGALETKPFAAGANCSKNRIEPPPYASIARSRSMLG